MAAFWIALPEVFLLCALCFILLLDSFRGGKDRTLIYYATQLSLLVTGAIVYQQSFDATKIGLNGMYVRDSLAGVLKLGVLFTTIMVTTYSRKYLNDMRIWRGEYFVLVLSAVLGMMIMISGMNLLILYLGLEMLALSLYALVAIRRDDGLASEAAMKYFVLGAIASGLLLYGLSILYGLSGSIDLPTMHEGLVVAAKDAPVAVYLGLTFVVAGLAFKFGVMPFHMWAPDVYHGAPAAVTLFLGSASKIAVLGLAMRLFFSGLDELNHAWGQMFMLLALLSVIGGNLIAIAQTNLRRLFAYSTIAHMGFVVMALITGTEGGQSAAVYYSIVYALMAAGGFALIVLLNRGDYQAGELYDLKGLNKRNPWAAFMMALLLFSMAGIPPTVGFYAKLSVIQSVIAVGMIWPAIIMVVMSVIGAFYYLRAIRLMYFEEPDQTEAVTATMDYRIVFTLNSLLMLALGLMPAWLMGICFDAVQNSTL